MLNQRGFESFGPIIGSAQRGTASRALFSEKRAGARCLLDEPIVQEIAKTSRAALVNAGRLSPAAVAIQAIAFDKTPSANWKVTWHQDLMFPFVRPVSTDGFTLPSKKDGVDYARPPQLVLEALLAVRIHLDDCDDTNGPLRVSPGTHGHGVIRSAEIPEVLSRHGEQVCLALAGEALLMKPLLLHASSPAQTPKHRRVLHLVFHSGVAMAEPWYRTV